MDILGNCERYMKIIGSIARSNCFVSLCYSSAIVIKKTSCEYSEQNNLSQFNNKSEEWLETHAV